MAGAWQVHGRGMASARQPLLLVPSHRQSLSRGAVEDGLSTSGASATAGATQSATQKQRTANLVHAQSSRQEAFSRTSSSRTTGEEEGSASRLHTVVRQGGEPLP